MRDKRKENLTAFHKEAIIKEANQLFFENGIAKTTMDDIAHASGYSKSTIYVYFKSKEDIYQHIISKCVFHIRDRLRELSVQCETGVDFYHAICDLLLDIHDKTPVFFDGITGKTVVKNNSNITPEILRVTNEARKEIYRIILERIEQSSKKNIIRTDIDHLEMVYVIWSCIYGIIEMGSSKAEYIEAVFHKDRKAFIRDGLSNLIRLVHRVRDK